MKKTRAELRGKPLDPECYRATVTHELINGVDCVYCYGLYEPMCQKCMAQVPYGLMSRYRSGDEDGRII